MTYLELCEKLRKRTGTGGGVMSDVINLTGALDRLTDYVNEAWREIQASREDWSFRWAEFSKTLTLGSQVYDMDSVIGSGTIQTIKPDILTIEAATDTNSRVRLVLMDYGYFEDLFGDKAASTGKPTYCAIEPGGIKIKFNTTLDVDYIIKGKYQKLVQSLSSKDDTPILPEMYHEAIFYLALMKWAEFEEADQIYVTARRGYEQWLTTMTNNLLPRILVGADAMA